MATSATSSQRDTSSEQLSAAFEWTLASFAAARAHRPAQLTPVANATASTELVDQFTESLEALGATQSGTPPHDVIAEPEFRGLLRFACVLSSPPPSAHRPSNASVQLDRITLTMWPDADSRARERLMETLHRAASALRDAAIKAELSIEGGPWSAESPLAAMCEACSPETHGSWPDGNIEVRAGYSARIERFRQQVASETGWLTPPHIDTIKRRPISELYVPSNVELAGGGKQYRASYHVEEVARCLYRTVVLGNPGGGKTTLAQRVANLLAEGSSTRLKTHLPLFVRLRGYRSDMPLIDFILSEVNKGVGDLLESDLRYLLSVGGATVLLDGLDELLDTAERRELVRAVQEFAEHFGPSPILVTSREIGYSEAPLATGGFLPWLLAPFDEKQAAEYVRKWFRADSGVSPDKQEEMAAGLLEECQEVPDLRSSPLLLSLLCQIYRGEGYIPRNRPAVYEKCAVMLFERWDRSRGLFAPTSIEAHLRPTMEHLAYWIYSSPSLANGVTEAQLIEQATVYLHTWRYESSADARAAALEFVEFCRGRAWVFTDTGTTAEGEPIYQFSHRTFLEYFAALDLVRTRGPSDELLATLLPKIASQEWDTVATMAVQIAADYRLGAGDELLQKALDAARSAGVGSERTAILAFVARCLAGLVPKPATTRAVCAAALSDAMQRLTSQRLDRYEHHVTNPGGSDDAALRSLDGLLNVAAANWGPAQTTMLEISDALMCSDRRTALTCADVFMNLSSLARSVVSTPTYARWQELTHDFAHRHRGALDELATTDALVGLDLVSAGLMAYDTFLGRFGAMSYFTLRPLPHGTGARISPAAHAFHWLVTGRTFFGMSSTAIIEGLDTAGRMLSRVAPPWVEHTTTFVAYDYEDTHPPEIDDLPESARFMAAALICIHLANDNAPRDSRWLQHLPPSRVVQTAQAILQARTGELSGSLESMVRETVSSPTGRDILMGWARGEYPLVGEPRQLRLDHS